MPKQDSCKLCPVLSYCGLVETMILAVRHFKKDYTEAHLHI